MIEELIYRIFETRNEAHLSHWTTDSYAEHVALEGFYSAVLGPLDELVENYQAAFGIIGEIPCEEDEEDEEPSVLKCLKDDVKWISKNRSKISKNISTLENIVDNISSIYLRTIYKLENLS